MSPGNSSPAGYTGLDRMPLAGSWRSGSSGDTATDTDPYTGDTLTEIPLADSSDVDTAYRAARDAQRDWAAALPSERAQVLHRAAQILDERRDEVVDWLVAEAGGVRARSEWEWGIVRADMLEAASYPFRVSGRILPAEIPGKESRVYRQPVGVVGVISPWNFPMHLSNRSVAPALAVGNGVVLKPAGDTPVTGGLLLAKIYEEAGLPRGLLSVVIGRGRDVGDSIVTHEIPRVVSFTGSTPVGKGIAAKAGLKKLSLELGGNGPLVVLDDADLDAAVDAAIFGNYFYQGQICMATNRVIVDRTLHDEFVERFVDRARGLPTGDPRDKKTRIGPIIPADGEQQALALANDTEYGLSSGVFTADTARGVRFALRVDAGMTHVNDTTVNDEINTAFGGEKNSGLGRFGGEWAIEEFTTDHWVSVQHTRRDYPL